MTEREKKELFSEIKQMVNIELAKQYINLIPCSKNDIYKFNKIYESSGLNENLSVYNEMQKDVDLIFNLTIDAYNDKNFSFNKEVLKNSSGYYNYVDTFIVILDFPIKDLNRAIINIHRFNNAQDAEYTYESGKFKGSYSIDKNCINVNMYMVGDMAYDKLFLRELSHELRHFYDMRKFKIIDKDKSKILYKLALEVLNGGKFDKKNVNFKIAFILYFTNKLEVLANCQGIYNELKGKNIINTENLRYDSNVYHQMCVCNNFFNEFKENKVDITKYDKSLFYNIEFSDILRYIEPNIRYCNSKISKAITKCIGDNFKNGTYDF